MSRSSHFFKEITQFDMSAFNLPIGVRAAIFVLVPLGLGLIINQPAFIFGTLGALFLMNTEGQPSILSSWILLVACFTESTAFALGTLAATTGLYSPILLAIAASIALMGRVSPRWSSLGTFTAITFATGLGLPGASVEAVPIRFLFMLAGGLWALFGVELHRLLAPKRPSPATSPGEPLSWSETVRSAVLLGIASAVGFSIGFILGLPRDFWVVITVIITVRPNISLTINFTSMMAIGTTIGAAIAAMIILATGDVYLLAAFLFVFAILTFASRGVNFGLVQIFLTPFIIILLNIIYPGEWYLALYRILEVAIGSAISMVMVYLLCAFKMTRA